MPLLNKEAILAAVDYRIFWEHELAGRITRRTGANWQARSPFREDRDPSFSVNVGNGLWNDFAGQSGDVFNFIMLRYGLSFLDALAYMERYASGAVNFRVVSPSNRPTPKAQAREYLPEEFQFREIVEGPLSHRKSGRMERGRFGKFLDLFGLPPKEAYLSAFLFSSPAVDYHKNPDLGNGIGSIAGFSGPVKASSLFFDFDCAEDPGKALWDVSTLLYRLEVLNVYSPQNISVFFSGCKGFHVLAADPDLERLPASEDVPQRVEAACRKLAGDLPTFDGKVYEKTRLLRAVNSRHPKTGLFKIPLTLEEVGDLALNMDGIRNLAKNQRRIGATFNPPEPALKGRA